MSVGIGFNNVKNMSAVTIIRVENTFTLLKADGEENVPITRGRR